MDTGQWTANRIFDSRELDSGLTNIQRLWFGFDKPESNIRRRIFEYSASKRWWVLNSPCFSSTPRFFFNWWFHSKIHRNQWYSFFFYVIDCYIKHYDAQINEIIKSTYKISIFALPRHQLLKICFSCSLVQCRDIPVMQTLHWFHWFSIADIYTIEFQKRGLPHAHILLILDNDDKIRDVEFIDNIICAEIPDRNVDPDLYDVITSNMMHGPCGPTHPNSRCMKGGPKCTKRYPQEFCDETMALSGSGEDSIWWRYCITYCLLWDCCNSTGWRYDSSLSRKTISTVSQPTDVSSCFSR